MAFEIAKNGKHQISIILSQIACNIKDGESKTKEFEKAKDLILPLLLGTDSAIAKPKQEEKQEEKPAKKRRLVKVRGRRAA
jgi:hypothetical protein